MPLYDFICADCGVSFELSLTLAEQSSDTPRKACPACASKNVRQQITLSGGGPLLGGTITVNDVKGMPTSAIEHPILNPSGRRDD